MKTNSISRSVSLNPRSLIGITLRAGVLSAFLLHVSNQTSDAGIDWVPTDSMVANR